MNNDLLLKEMESFIKEQVKDLTVKYSESKERCSKCVSIEQFYEENKKTTPGYPQFSALTFDDSDSINVEFRTLISHLVKYATQSDWNSFVHQYFCHECNNFLKLIYSFYELEDEKESVRILDIDLDENTYFKESNIRSLIHFYMGELVTKEFFEGKEESIHLYALYRYDYDEIYRYCLEDSSFNKENPYNPFSWFFDPSHAFKPAAEIDSFETTICRFEFNKNDVHFTSKSSDSGLSGFIDGCRLTANIEDSLSKAYYSNKDKIFIPSEVVDVDGLKKKNNGFLETLERDSSKDFRISNYIFK